MSWRENKQSKITWPVQFRLFRTSDQEGWREGPGEGRRKHTGGNPRPKLPLEFNIPLFPWSSIPGFCLLCKLASGIHVNICSCSLLTYSCCWTSTQQWHHSSKPQLALTHFCLPVSFLGMNLLFVPWPSYHSYTNYHWWNILIFNNLVILNLDSHNGLRCQVCCCQLHGKEGSPSMVSTTRPLCLQQTETALLPPPSIHYGELWTPAQLQAQLNQGLSECQRKDERDELDSQECALGKKNSERIKQPSGNVQGKTMNQDTMEGASRSWTWECRPV